jgi:hypothetical protein
MEKRDLGIFPLARPKPPNANKNATPIPYSSGVSIVWKPTYFLERATCDNTPHHDRIGINTAAIAVQGDGFSPPYVVSWVDGIGIDCLVA